MKRNTSGKYQTNRRITYQRSAPESFHPPFQANVLETFTATDFQGDLQSAVERTLQEPLPALRRLMDIRNFLVSKLGFVTTSSQQGLYGPFKVHYPDKKKMCASFDDPNFQFYAELIHQSDDLHCHSAVQFKTALGRIYFYTIYPVHLRVYKFLLRKIANQ